MPGQLGNKKNIFKLKRHVKISLFPDNKGRNPNRFHKIRLSEFNKDADSDHQKSTAFLHTDIPTVYNLEKGLISFTTALKYYRYIRKNKEASDLHRQA